MRQRADEDDDDEKEKEEKEDDTNDDCHAYIHLYHVLPIVTSTPSLLTIGGVVIL